MFIESFWICKILQVDNGTEFKNKLLEGYCNENNIKLIHSSPYHPQTNGVCEVVHKEIRKYIYTEFFKNKNNFNIEDELFNIIKIYNNKIHSSTKRTPKEIGDIDDINEINDINNEIIKTLSKKIKILTSLTLVKTMLLIIIKYIFIKIKFSERKEKLKNLKSLLKFLLR